MKELLPGRVTGLKLVGWRASPSSRILPFPSSFNGAAGRKTEARPNADPIEQNIFKYYFRSYGSEQGRLEEFAYAVLWTSGLLALLLAAWHPLSSINGSGG